MAPWFHFHDASPNPTPCRSGRWGGLFRALLALPLSWLAPPHCAACGQRLGREAVFCVPCGVSIEPARPSPWVPGTPPVRAACAYGGALAVAILRYKYRGHSHLGPELGRLIRGAVRPLGAPSPGAAVVMPVPLHPRQLAERGFNQATPLAAAAAAELGLALDCGALRRVRDTPQQARLDAASRRSNLAQAFSVVQPDRVEGRAVLLVDDVATTGATLAACARALRRAGAASVQAVVLARAEPPGGAQRLRTVELTAAAGASRSR